VIGTAEYGLRIHSVWLVRLKSIIRMGMVNSVNDWAALLLRSFSCFPWQAQAEALAAVSHCFLVGRNRLRCTGCYRADRSKSAYKLYRPYARSPASGNARPPPPRDCCADDFANQIT